MAVALAFAGPVYSSVVEQSHAVLFDGHCSLCSRFVQIVVTRDRERIFRFVPLQSDEGRRMRQRAGVPENCDTVVLIESTGRSLIRSSAVLRVFELLGYRWTARVLALVPPFLADAAYRFIARHRLLLFRQADSCTLPDR